MKKRERVRVVGGCKDHVVVERKTDSGDLEHETFERGREGKPIRIEHGVYSLDRTAEGIELVEHIAPSKGPARVSSKAYRDGYSRIFGSRSAARAELN